MKNAIIEEESKTESNDENGSLTSVGVIGAKTATPAPISLPTNSNNTSSIFANGNTLASVISQGTDANTSADASKSPVAIPSSTSSTTQKKILKPLKKEATISNTNSFVRNIASDSAKPASVKPSNNSGSTGTKSNSKPYNNSSSNSSTIPPSPVQEHASINNSNNSHSSNSKLNHNGGHSHYNKSHHNGYRSAPESLGYEAVVYGVEKSLTMEQIREDLEGNDIQLACNPRPLMHNDKNSTLPVHSIVITLVDEDTFKQCIERSLPINYSMRRVKPLRAFQRKKNVTNSGYRNGGDWTSSKSNSNYGGGNAESSVSDSENGDEGSYEENY